MRTSQIWQNDFKWSFFVCLFLVRALLHSDFVSLHIYTLCTHARFPLCQKVQPTKYLWISIKMHSYYYLNILDHLLVASRLFLMFKLVIEKAEEPEIKLPTSAGSWKKQESSRKTSISALLTMTKPLTVWITINCGKFWKRWEYQTTLPASWEICMQVKKQQLETGKEQRTNSKLSPYLFNFYAEYLIQNAGLDEAQARIKISGKNINNFRYADDITLMMTAVPSPPAWGLPWAVPAEP